MGLFGIPFIFRKRRSEKLKLEILEPSRRYFTRDQILMLPLSGMVNIGSSDAMTGREGMLITLKDRLKAALKNDRLRAVILKIDSPGGEVTASDLILREILEFKRKRKIPVIAFMGTMATSGGLYVAMAADEIYALPTTITGSIGVIAMFPGMMGLGDKLGVEMRIFKSGANKDLGSPWRTMSDEQRGIFQNLVDTMNARFREVIVQSRGAKGLEMTRFQELADGRILDPMTAWGMHLIDGVKYPDEVIERAKQVAGVDDAKLVSYEYSHRFRGNIYAQWPLPAPLGHPLWSALAGAAGLGPWGAWPGGESAARPVFMYLWMP